MGGKSSHVPNPTRKALCDLQREGFSLKQILELSESAETNRSDHSDKDRDEPVARDPDPDLDL